MRKSFLTQRESRRNVQCRSLCVYLLVRVTFDDGNFHTHTHRQDSIMKPYYS